MNILIKLTCLIGLVIAPILGQDMAVAETPVIDEVTMQMDAENGAAVLTSEGDGAGKSSAATIPTEASSEKELVATGISSEAIPEKKE